MTRDGSIAVSLIALLLVVEIAVVGVVVMGRGDQDLTARRLEAVRAFYAAEGAGAMAMRELVTNTDEDGDGGVGTISNDDDPETDPAIGEATAFVSSEVKGPDIVLTCEGSSGQATRRLELTLTTAP